MTIKRTIYCGICSEHCEEAESGAGFWGWGQIRGVKFEHEGKTVEEPRLCPSCLAKVMESVCKIAEDK